MSCCQTILFDDHFQRKHIMTNVFSNIVTQLDSIKHESKITNSKKTIVTGVGQQIKNLILAGKLTNKQILAKVLEDNPARKTTYACVAWYQSDLKKKAIVQNNSAADTYYGNEIKSLTSV